MNHRPPYKSSAAHCRTRKRKARDRRRPDSSASSSRSHSTLVTHAPIHLLVVPEVLGERFLRSGAALLEGVGRETHSQILRGRKIFQRGTFPLSVAVVGTRFSFAGRAREPVDTNTGALGPFTMASVRAFHLQVSYIRHGERVRVIGPGRPDGTQPFRTIGTLVARVAPTPSIPGIAPAVS